MRCFTIATAILKHPAKRGGGFAAGEAVHTVRSSLRIEPPQAALQTIHLFSGQYIKVHAFSRYIGLREELPEQEQFLLECAALVHDIGIEPVHIARNARIAKQIFRRTRKFFAVVLYVRQEKLTKLCGKFAARRALSGYVDRFIKPAEAQYGECGGKLQERLGPPEAEKILSELQFPRQDAEHICCMVTHHHTYDSISGRDIQILIEADFIVNLFEDGASDGAVRNAYRRIFRTESGKALLRTV